MRDQPPPPKQHTHRFHCYYMPMCNNTKNKNERFFFVCFVRKGNFAEFLENADSVSGLSAEDGGSFVNMFALPELKVRIVSSLCVTCGFGCLLDDVLTSNNTGYRGWGGGRGSGVYVMVLYSYGLFFVLLV